MAYVNTSNTILTVDSLFIYWGKLHADWVGARGYFHHHSAYNCQQWINTTSKYKLIVSNH